MSEGHDQGNRSGLMIVGVIMLLIGMTFLGNLGWDRLGLNYLPLRNAIAEIRAWMPGIALIVLGTMFVVFGSKGGFHAHAPGPGARLFRSRDSKVIAGVLGGMAEYFSMDPTLLRLLVVAVALLTDAGPFILAYVIAAIVIPYRPEGQPAAAAQPFVTQAPAPPQAPEPPAPPAPPQG